MTIIKDFSIVVPERIICKLGKVIEGQDQRQEVDISVFPASATLKIIEIMNPAQAGATLSRRELVTIIAEACQAQNPVVTEEWLLKNVPLKQLQQFVDFTFTTLMQQLNEVKDPLTPAPDGTEKPVKSGADTEKNP